MNKEEKQSIEIRWLLIVITLLAAGVIFLGARIAVEKIEKDKRAVWLETYLPEPAVESILKWSDYYKLDFVKVLAVLYAESEGKKQAKSHTKDYGYMQLSGETAGLLRNRLKHYLENTDIYETEFNIAGGALYLKTLLDYFADEQDDVFQDWQYAVECYNVGYYGWRKGRTNPKHLKKWLIYYTYFKIEWNKFKRLI